MRVGLNVDAQGPGREPKRMTPPPEFPVQPSAGNDNVDAERDPWWFMRALGQEAYQKHF